MASIKMSMNELASLLKRSFEGIGYCQADYEDAAATIVWLESHGLDGFGLTDLAWSRLPGYTTIHPTPHENEASVATIDCAGLSMLVCGRSVMEFAIAKAGQGSNMVVCQNATDRRAIISSLPLGSASSLHVIAYWRNRTELHIATAEAGHPCPDYTIVAAASLETPPSNTIQVVASVDLSKIQRVVSDLQADAGEVRVISQNSPTMMLSCHRESLERGINVNSRLIARLSTAADRVLVESTDQSRRGAGEDA